VPQLLALPGPEATLLDRAQADGHDLVPGVAREFLPGDRHLPRAQQ